MAQVYDLLEDDGIFVLQVAGIRPHWQYEDLLWGLFMNKYVFPGADASCALNWVIGQVENVGFEVKSVDVLGVHCELDFGCGRSSVFLTVRAGR